MNAASRSSNITPKPPRRCFVVISDRWRFDYIEQTEKQKCKCLPYQAIGREQQDQQESYDLIPNHTAMVMITERPAGNSASPDSDDEQHANQQQKFDRIKEVIKHPE